MNSILSGIGAGITYALTSWGKKEGQEFDWIKFGRTVILGAICGMAFEVTGAPFDLTMTYLINLGAVPVIENLLLIIKRKVLEHLF